MILPNNLILLSDSKIEINSKYFKRIKTIENIFTIDRSKSLVFLYKDYQLFIFDRNFNKINKININKKVLKLSFMNIENKGILLISTENELIKYNFINNDLIKEKEIKIKNIKKIKNDENNFYILTENKINIYNKSLEIVKSIICNDFYVIKDILLISIFNTLKIYIKEENKINIEFPSKIKFIYTDKLFTKIYVYIENKVYRYCMNGRKIKELEIEIEDLVKIEMSVCGRYLLIIEKKKIYILDEEEILLEKINTEEIKEIEIY